MEGSAKGSLLMGVGGVKSRDLPVSARRIVAMVVAIGCHLVLLMALLRPAAPRTDMAPEVENDEAALKVRFISPRALPAPRLVAPPLDVSPEAAVKQRMPRSVQRVAQVGVRLPEADSSDASPASIAPNTPSAPDQYTNNQTPTGDGGFRDRVLNSQHSQGIPGVPGSDRRVAPDLELTNPKDQGVGSVVRSTQRLFGITDRHCIDVEVWQHLTADELKVRYLSAADVEKESERYNCNRPLGLSF
ncbi:hypothetical protein [Dyella sp. Tek66A03]|uniref:hypothetical protein n=1 Tax=Dyella sp. Tek66A03 TaxID=3458298 RepID=UPI00403EE25B